jgi:hypothetical protein
MMYVRELPHQGERGKRGPGTKHKALSVKNTQPNTADVIIKAKGMVHASQAFKGN